MKFKSFIRYSHAQTKPLSVRQVATAYNFPVGKATGKGYIGGIVELGGGYDPKQLAQYFTANGLPTPTFVDVSVDGGSNTPDGPNGADGEVQLDLEVAGAVAPGATYRIYFAGNGDAAFLAALKQATSECNGVSISWGAAESNWDPTVMGEFEAVIKAARTKGVPVFVAAGDTGADDSTGTPQTDFPASSPSAIGCGGTRLEINAKGERASETVWNDNPTQSATGGGVSKHFPGRQVPDIAGNADPESGFEIMVDGQSAVVGGTSAVAPLFLGLHALLWELNGGKAFDFVNLVSTPGVCFDVTIGNNGGFRAGPGRDSCTGLGVPDGAKLVAALVGGAPAPTPAPPAPPADPNGCCAKLKRIADIVNS